MFIQSLLSYNLSALVPVLLSDATKKQDGSIFHMAALQIDGASYRSTS